MELCYEAKASLWRQIRVKDSRRKKKREKACAIFGLLRIGVRLKEWQVLNAIFGIH